MINKKMFKNSLILTLTLNLKTSNKIFFTLDDNWVAEGVAFLVATLIDEDDEMIITNIFTVEKFRGNGYANALLLKAIEQAKCLNYKYIKLTDCSDNFMFLNNLYLKNNFKYDEVGLPEMTLKL